MCLYLTKKAASEIEKRLGDKDDSTRKLTLQLKVDNRKKDMIAPNNVIWYLYTIVTTLGMQCCHWRCCWHHVSQILVLCQHWHQKHLKPLNYSLNLQKTIMPSIVLLASNDTDISTGSSNGTESHIVPLYNHLNMLNAMVSSMAP